MSIQIDDVATDEAVRRLARLNGKSLTATIREAVENEYRRECEKPLMERIRRIQDRLAALARPGGVPADKAFFDEFPGEL
jgi:hypothetical protein